jgi:hypothetical protein
VAGGVPIRGVVCGRRRPAGLSEWLLRIGAVHLSFPRLLTFLKFPGYAGTQLAVGWTLAIEMIFSLLLPFLVLAARPLHGLALLAVALALLVVWPAAGLPAHALDSSTHSPQPRARVRHPPVPKHPHQQNRAHRSTAHPPPAVKPHDTDTQTNTPYT